MRQLTIFIGASSKICSAYSKLNPDSNCSFFGRTNPDRLTGFVEYSGISDESSIKELTDALLATLDSKDNVNCANIVFVAGVSDKGWKKCFLVNELMPAILSEAVSEYLIERNRRGSLTYISSSSAYAGANKIPYAATKASLNGIMHSITKKYSPSVRANIIVPNAFDSGMISDWSATKKESVGASNMCGEIGRPEDVASAIQFCISNKHLTNSVINLTAGSVLMG